MEQKENNYRVTGRLTIDFQIIMQALDSDEAELFANDIHLDKWAEINREWQVLDVSKNYFLKQVNAKAPSVPTLKNHTGREQVIAMKNYVAQKFTAKGSEGAGMLFLAEPASLTDGAWSCR